MKKNNDFFNSISELKAPQKKLLFKAKNGELRINEEAVLSFKFEKQVNDKLIKKLWEDIEVLESDLKHSDLYEKVLIQGRISKLEKRIEKENHGGLKNWRLICQLDSWSRLDEIKSLILKADTDNIWSILYMLGVEFGDEFGENNLYKIMTDRQLDDMSESEATSYKYSRNLPRTRENIME